MTKWEREGICKVCSHRGIHSMGLCTRCYGISYRSNHTLSKEQIIEYRKTEEYKKKLPKKHHPWKKIARAQSRIRGYEQWD